MKTIGVLDIIVIVVILATNINWYRIKSFLSENGCHVEWFSGHFQDFKNLKELKNSSRERMVQKKGERLWFLMKLSLIVSFFALILIVIKYIVIQKF